MELINPHREIERIEMRGEKLINREKLKVEKFMGRLTTAKTFKGYLTGSLAVAKKDKNLELSGFISELIEKYNYYEKTARVNLEKWKGKSSIEIIKQPNRIIVITYQKPAKDEIPHKITTEITKYELNCLISAFNQFSGDIPIKTRDLAREYCKVAQIKETDENEPLFREDGFIWNSFFACRSLHCHFNIMLRVLDKLGLTQYKGGWSKIICNKLDIQLIL